MKIPTRKQIKYLSWTLILNGLGLIIFKYIPMSIYGHDILFDASSHIAWTGFGLYFIWSFMEKENRFKRHYLVLSGIIMILMAIQRILAFQHNIIGIILGFLVISFAIIIPKIKKIDKRN